MSMPGRSAKADSVSGSSSATKPRLSTTPTGSSSTTACRWKSRRCTSAGAGDRADHRQGRAGPHRGHRRSWLWVRLGRSRPAGSGGPLRRHPSGQWARYCTAGVRAPKSVPRQDQMAHRMRRTNQPPQTQSRMEPYRTHHARRRTNLVWARGLRPQPSQDRRLGSMTDKSATDTRQTSRPVPATSQPAQPRQPFFRSK
jgi:hypothetical protein